MATAPGSDPILRVRIEHSRTQRDGWGYSSTVELTAPCLGDDDERNAVLAGWLQRVRALGEAERDIRNARDGRQETM